MTTYYKSLLPSTVGFDRLLSTIEDFESVLGGTKIGPRNTYPPYNIVKESENDYTIEIAISGFKREDIEITLEKNKLLITGISVSDDSKQRNYLHKGIASRNFTHVFTLNDTVIVKDADIVDGLLVITLENIIPEQNKARKIPIGVKEESLLT